MPSQIITCGYGGRETEPWNGRKRTQSVSGSVVVRATLSKRRVCQFFVSFSTTRKIANFRTVAKEKPFLEKFFCNLIGLC